IPSAARSIAPGAFRELDGLLNITIEKGMLREIPEYAFAGCKDLEMLISSEGLRTIGREAFAGCAKLTVINLPEGLAAIGDRAFAGCGASEGIYLPLGLKSLGDGAFAGCGARHVAIDTLSSMGEGVFANCVQLEELYYHKDNVRSIGRNAFSGCVSLKDISFPEKLKTIEEGAFSGCAAITKLDFPDGLRTIGKNAFSGCAGLKNILFPEFFNTVEEGAFSGCAALESMTIPADMSAAPDSFFGCVNVKNINIDGEQKIGPLGWLAPLFEGRKPNIRFNNKSDRLGVNTIADGAFQGCDFLPKGFYQKIYSYKRIGKNAFAGLTKLTEMSFSTRLETIDEGAFAGCVNLTTLVFEENDRNPSRLSAIGARAFAGCAALECVRIPKAVASIGEDAFADCPNLKVIYISGKTEELYRKGAITINHPAVTFSEEDYLRAFRAKITELSQKTLRYGDTRFYSGVKEIRIPNDMEHISGSFEGCTSLKSLSIPKNIETIGRHAFKGCTGIKTLVLPAARIKIEEGAFEGCTALESITFRKNPEGLEIDRHRRAGIEKEAFKGCTSLKSIHFPGFFGFIEEGAFMGCAALEKISFSERENPLHDRPLEEYLGKDAFADCAALREVEAADGWFLTGDTEKLSGIFRNTPFLEKQTGFREEMHSQGRCVYCGGKVKYFSKKCETCGRENGEPVNVQLIAGFGIILVPAAIAAVVLMLTGMMPVEYLNRMISSVFPVLIPVFIFIFIKILRSHRKNRHAPSGEAKKRDPSYPEPAFKAEIRFLGRCMYCGGRLRLFSNTCRECGREN
ncbi:MAG: leucine-rich repeat domain-containing protein, partial [Treponema sp.]|nr:leucine-rich repeat domain-containing protein [Treponema sp.]